VKQVVCDFAVRLLEEFLVELLDRLIVMRCAQRFVLIQSIKGLKSGLDPVDIRAEGLSAARDASAGACHDFDEVQVFASGLDLLYELLRVAYAVGDGDSDFKVADLTLLLDAVKSLLPVRS
jgi:hypothetical protein